MKIAVFSSSVAHVSENNAHIAERVGKYLAEKNITTVTGGCVGIPGVIVQSAFAAGGKTEVFSPDCDDAAHAKRHDNLDLNYFKEKHFIPGFTARSLAMIKAVDAAIILNGRIGTLSEFTIALEEGLQIGVITGTGGIADHLEYIIAVAKKEFPNQIFFGDDYQSVIDTLVTAIQVR